MGDRVISAGKLLISTPDLSYMPPSLPLFPQYLSGWGDTFPYKSAQNSA